MIAAAICFWVLVFLGREELGLKGMALAATLWLVLLFGSLATSIAPSLFTAATAILDVVLVLIIFGGDIKLR